MPRPWIRNLSETGAMCWAGPWPVLQAHRGARGSPEQSWTCKDFESLFANRGTLKSTGRQESNIELGHCGFVYACFHTQYVNKLCSQVVDVIHDINESFIQRKEIKQVRIPF